jgi:hypothetical protein
MDAKIVMARFEVGFSSGPVYLLLDAGEYRASL